MQRFSLILSGDVLILGTVLLAAVSINARRNIQNPVVSASPNPHIAPSVEVKPEGTKLPLKYRCLGDGNFKQATFTPLTSGQMLVGVCDALYLLDSQRKVVWQYTVPQWLYDYAYIEATGLVYGTAGDNTMFIIDAASGKEVVFNSRNGSAGYGEVKAYGKDQCLITDNNWGYRDRLNDPTIRDGITAWRGTQILWSADFPPDANLIINDDKILAVSKTKNGIFVKEIDVPKSK